MKMLLHLSLTAVMAVLVGCATPRRVSSMQGAGTKRVYAAAFDPVWRATIDAAQRDGLHIITTDRNLGYIDARRSVRAHTLGENVGIWVTQAGPETTAVEVLSRQAGPPVVWLKNWENEIHRSIAANLSKEIPAMGVAPRETYIDAGVSNDQSRLRGTVAVPEPPLTLRDQQLRYNELRTRRDAGERALSGEVDETKREILQRQVDRLREDLRLQEQRLRELEGEVK